jgi:hypothetical protein
LSCLSNGTSLLGPQVYSTCNSTSPIRVENGSHPTTDLSGQITFPTRNVNQTWSTDITSLFSLWNQSNPTAAIWVDSPYIRNNTPSIATAFISVNDTEMTIVTCSLYATWQSMEAFTQPAYDAYVHSPPNDDFAGTHPETLFDKLDAPYDGRTHIQLDADWASVALPPEDTFLQLLLKWGTNRYEDPLCISFSPLVADALGRVEMDTDLVIGIDYDASVWNTSNDTAIVINNANINMSNTTALIMTIFRNGYSYSMEGITRKLAVAILLTHILLVIIHTVVVVSYGWKSPALNSLSDAFSLAINTPPSETPGRQNSSAVKIQSVSDGCLGFVLDDGGKSGDLEMRDKDEVKVMVEGQ